MSNPVEKMTIKNLADELGVSKNTVRNQLVNSGFDLAQYKENGIIMLDKELIGVVRSIYRSKSDQLTGQLPVNNTGSDFPLEKENEFLRDQLAEKDKHISELTEMIRDQQKLTLLQQQKNESVVTRKSRIKKSKMVAILEVRCDMDKIDLREETVDRIELMYERLADYLNLPDEDNYSEMLERIMDVLNSVINADLAKSSV
ncbi:hypothetical protein, partial [Staphylococcus epidermidis]